MLPGAVRQGAFPPQGRCSMLPSGVEAAGGGYVTGSWPKAKEKAGLATGRAFSGAGDGI